MCTIFTRTTSRKHLACAQSGLHERVGRAAAAFAGPGVRRGDRVALLMTNRPEFVEATLAGHPAVADVAVIGAKHERWGETPIAVVVPADPAAPPTLDDLTSWSGERLSSYKKPTSIVVVGRLPRNAAGKVLKHELRAKYGA